MRPINTNKVDERSSLTKAKGFFIVGHLSFSVGDNQL